MMRKASFWKDFGNFRWKYLGYGRPIGMAYFFEIPHSPPGVRPAPGNPPARASGRRWSAIAQVGRHQGSLGVAMCPP
jgi:hypothetical protein